MKPEPYYEEEGIALYCGKMEEIVPTLGSFDAIVTDPPYTETSLAWDVWVKGWPSLLLQHSAVLWSFGSMRMFWKNRDEFTGWELAQDIIWEKQNGSGLANDRFRRVHELALQFYQGRWEDIYKATPMVPAPYERSSKIARSNKPRHWNTTGSAEYVYGEKRLMRSVIPVPNCHGYAVNETQKPEGIIAPILEYSVPPGGSVLDAFAGSGTVLAVARSQGKRAVGIEKRPEQCEQIVARLSQKEMCFA